MSTVILASAPSTHPSLVALLTLLQAELAQTGESVRTFELSTTPLAYCQGEFDCWVKTPGVCRSMDAEQEIVKAIHDADHLVLLDTITFGGHTSTLKRAQDRLICLLSPFFEKRAALTHHEARYEKVQSLFALGFSPTPNPDEADTWRALAEANAINMLAPRVGVAVVDDTDRERWPSAIRTMLASDDVPGKDLHERAPLREALLEVAKPTYSPFALVAPRKAAFFVGSAKPKGTSASESMASAMAEILRNEGVATDLYFAKDFVHGGEHAEATARTIAAADLFVLVTPLYFDSLPALTTAGLEHVARARGPISERDRATRGRFVALFNCGFPEPEQNRTALRIARHFSDKAGYHFAGGLALGGGGMLKPSIPLHEQGGPMEHVKQALDAASHALALGENVPPEALELLMKAPLPDSLYRLMGDLGWRYQAHQRGLPQIAIKARPLG